MACPHVTAAAALIRSAHPRWSPSAIRSALLTTAPISNSLAKPLTTSSGGDTDYHDMGSGDISRLRAPSPGLVFKTTTQDYLDFLCYYGYKDQVIRPLSGTNSSAAQQTPRPVSSPTSPTSTTRPSPSLCLDSSRRGSVTVTRTAINIGALNSTYTVSLVLAQQAGSVNWSNGAHLAQTAFAVNVV